MASEFTIKFEIFGQITLQFVYTCIFMLGLLFINNFTILNSSYTGMVTRYENYEGNYLDEVLNLEAYEVQDFFEISKVKLKKFKKFVDLLNNNRDYTDNYLNKESIIVNKNDTIEKGTENLRIRKIFGDNSKPEADLKASYSLLFLSSTLNWKNPKAEEENLVDSILFRLDGNVYLYPGFYINNTNYTNLTFQEDLNNLYKITKKKYSSEIKDKDSEKKEFISENPIPFFSREAKDSFNISFPYDKPNDETSINYDNDKVLFNSFTYSDQETIGKDDDFFSLIINNPSLKNYIFKYNFPTISMVSTFPNDKLIYNFPCHYLLYLYEMVKSEYNLGLYNESKTGLDDIKSCISFEKSKITLNDYFKIGNESAKGFFRKIKLELYPSSSLSKIMKLLGQANINSSFKVYYIKLPLISKQIYSEEISNSEIGGYNIGFYLFKDLTNSKLEINDIYVVYYCFILFQICIFVSFWLLLLIYYLIAGKRLVSIVFLPIEKLIRTFKKFNLKKQSPDTLTVKEMSYSYDSDINKLFQVCKNMLSGKFYRKDEDKERLVLMYRKNFFEKIFFSRFNMSYIKYHNLMITDEIPDRVMDESLKDPIEKGKQEVIDLCKEEERKMKIKYDYIKPEEETLFDEIFNINDNENDEI